MLYCIFAVLYFLNYALFWHQWFHEEPFMEHSWNLSIIPKVFYSGKVLILLLKGFLHEEKSGSFMNNITRVSPKNKYKLNKMFLDLMQ